MQEVQELIPCLLYPPVSPPLPAVSQVPGEPARLVPDPRHRDFLGVAQRLLPRSHVHPPHAAAHRHRHPVPGSQQLRRGAASRRAGVVAGVCVRSVLSLACNVGQIIGSRLCFHLKRGGMRSSGRRRARFGSSF